MYGSTSSMHAAMIPSGPPAHRHNVRPRAGLAHREGADVLSGNELRQIFFLLRCIAVAPDLVDAKIRMRTVRQPDRCRCPADLLHGDHMSEIPHFRAAI